MARVNIAEVKVNWSSFLDRVEKGETIIICRRNVPIAEIRPLAAKESRRRRVVGRAKGLKIPSSFFEPLPEDLVRAFEGSDR